MYKLFRSLDRESKKGGALPSVWPSFAEHGIKFFPSDLVMWAGPPGAGKSAAALNYALKAKLPTLYVSLDMGPRLVANRICAISTGDTVDQVEEAMRTPEGEARYRRVLEDVDHLYVTYPSRPTPEGIAKAQMAFMEIHGVPSSLMVIDNLMNMNSGAKDEWSGLRELSQAFHYFATELGITVLLLHHINVGGIDLSYPAPENYIKGQVSELPASIISFAKQEGKLLASAVKNRHGPADHTGKRYFTLGYDQTRQIISEYVPEVVKKPAEWSIKKPPASGWHDWGIKD